MDGLYADSESSAGCLGELQSVALLHRALGDEICLWVLVVAGVLGIGIDRSLVLAALVEEVELHGALVSVLVALAGEEPVVAALCLACYGDVAGRFSLDILTVGPVDGNILDKLEGFVVLGIVLRQIGCHLQRTPHDEIEGKLGV